LIKEIELRLPQELDWPEERKEEWKGEQREEGKEEEAERSPKRPRI
jgi:hypothetical protein